VPEPEGSQSNDELVKQEMLVQYLQDAYGFSQKITEAIGIISKMMYENTTTGRPGADRNTVLPAQCY
jgi:condensin complex subunit 1